MVNTNINTTGYCIIGIADTKNDADKFKCKYNDEIIKFNNFYITGVQSEIGAHHKDLDSYYTNVTNYISNEKISKRDKEYILNNIKFINYYDKKIIVLELKSDKTPSVYNNKYYTRYGSNNNEVSAEDYAILFEKFVSAK